MSKKKVIFKKPFAYKYDSKDDVQLSVRISPFGEGVFKDIDWRMYDDNTMARAGINLKKHKNLSRRRNLINYRKTRITY